MRALLTNPPAAAVASAVAPMLVDAQAAALALGISPRTLYALTKDGQIRHVRIGRRVLYDPADLRAWIEARKVGGELAAARIGVKGLDGAGTSE